MNKKIKIYYSNIIFIKHKTPSFSVDIKTTNYVWKIVIQFLYNYFYIIFNTIYIYIMLNDNYRYIFLISIFVMSFYYETVYIFRIRHFPHA